MRGLDELDLGVVERAEDAVDPVAGVAVYEPHTVPVQPVEDVRADGLGHSAALPRPSESLPATLAGAIMFGSRGEKRDTGERPEHKKVTAPHLEHTDFGKRD